ncbi:AAA family ATPase [uncultured Cohaesibacter sp.]|uniref:AAA family ATPase n=1 Tax=uncultured Cohaesibacter sp. TaxID=1002546 RepID=UPI002AA88CA0|nr:AAA family ATPase [uncultured Cohaesibacter sp.]
MALVSITITGSHGVGKTTLADDVLRRLAPNLSIGLVREPARELARMGMQVNDQISEDGVFEYLTYCMSEVRTTEQTLLIKDRSVLDLYAYTIDLFGSRFSRSLEKLVVEHILNDRKSTKFVVYVPIEFDLQLDGLRPADVNYQLHIDKVILELLEKFEFPVLSVSGTLQNRSNQIVEELKNRGLI